MSTLASWFWSLLGKNMPMNEFLKKLSLLNIETIFKMLVFKIVRFWCRNNQIYWWDGRESSKCFTCYRNIELHGRKQFIYISEEMKGCNSLSYDLIKSFKTCYLTSNKKNYSRCLKEATIKERNDFTEIQEVIFVIWTWWKISLARHKTQRR